MFVTVQHYESYYRYNVNSGLRSSLYSLTHSGELPSVLVSRNVC